METSPFPPAPPSASSPQGDATGGPAKPVPRRPREEGVSRRQLLVMAAGALMLPSARAARADTTLVAAWQDGAEQRIGQLAMGEASWRVQRWLAVPTRAHGLFVEAGGTVLVVARRPGDWLLRWHPHSGQTQWHWIDGDRRFNGHVIARTEGAALWTTETDLETAQGRIGVRDVGSLEKVDEWASHGMDPHQLLALPRAVGVFPAGTLMVANGGVPTLPETGRSRREISRMDASLVALQPETGSLLGQWRLDDPYLSIRHLAFDAASGTLGIALQAEHPAAEAKAAAPVLAVWDGSSLRTSSGQPALAGYGGDICALPASAGGGFAVSCPRTHTLALFDRRACWRGSLSHPEACALAASGSHWWLSGGQGAAGMVKGAGTDVTGVHRHAGPAAGRNLHIDNHWVLLAG